MPRVLIKRGTRAQMTAAANAGQLAAGECYLMTDEDRLSIGKSATAFVDTARLGEGQSVPKLFVRPGIKHAAGAAVCDPMSVRTAIVGSILFVPHCEPRDTLISALGITVTTSANGVAWLGVYDNTKATGYDLPGQLLRRISSSINTSSTGYFEKTLTSPLMLTAGNTYWFALVVTALADVRGISYASRYASMGYTPDIAFFVTYIRTVETTYNALPDNAPQNYTDYALLYGSILPAIFMS